MKTQRKGEQGGEEAKGRGELQCSKKRKLIKKNFEGRNITHPSTSENKEEY